MRTSLKHTTLANGQRVACVSSAEVQRVHDQVQEYFRHGIEVRPGDIVFDVGANIGLFALEACRRAEGRATVYAFEPIPITYQALRENAERYHREQLIPIQQGLSDKVGSARFAFYPLLSPMSTAYPADDFQHMGEVSMKVFDTPGSARSFAWMSLIPRPLRRTMIDFGLRVVLRPEWVTCQLNTLSNVLRERQIDHIDLLKIDVEKAELDVLNGIAAEDWPKIRQVVVEVHDIAGRVAQVSDLLKRQGFAKIAQETEEDMTDFGVYTLYARRS